MMQVSRWLGVAVVVAGVCALSPLVRAQDAAPMPMDHDHHAMMAPADKEDAPAEHADKHGEQAEKEADLEDIMKGLGDEFKALRKQIAQADHNENSLQRLAKMEDLALDAKEQTPPSIMKLPAADRPAKEAAYRKEMNKLVVALCAVEDALLDGQQDKAGELFKQIGAIQKEGHGEFRKKEQH